MFHRHFTWLTFHSTRTVRLVLTHHTIKVLSELLLIDARVHSAHGDGHHAWSDAIEVMRLMEWEAHASFDGIDDLASYTLAHGAYSLWARLAIESNDVLQLRTALAALPDVRPMSLVAMLRHSIGSLNNLQSLAKTPEDGPGVAKELAQASALMASMTAAATHSQAPADNHPEIQFISRYGHILDRAQIIRLEVSWCNAVTSCDPTTWADLQIALNGPFGQALAARCGSLGDMLCFGPCPLQMFNKPKEDDRARHQATLIADLEKLFRDDPEPFSIFIASTQTSFAVEILTYKIESEARRRLTRAALAVAIMRIHTGSLPQDLSAIIGPGLLPSVPLDPFDGMPIHYDARKGQLFSVGRNIVVGGDPHLIMRVAADPDENAVTRPLPPLPSDN
jgi:hypothetical protein